MVPHRGSARAASFVFPRNRLAGPRSLTVLSRLDASRRRRRRRSPGTRAGCMRYRNAPLVGSAQFRGIVSFRKSGIPKAQQRGHTQAYGSHRSFHVRCSFRLFSWENAPRILARVGRGGGSHGGAHCRLRNSSCSNPACAPREKRDSPAPLPLCRQGGPIPVLVQGPQAKVIHPDLPPRRFPLSCNWS
jgi:hypothetical protein